MKLKHAWLEYPITMRAFDRDIKCHLTIKYFGSEFYSPIDSIGFRVDKFKHEKLEPELLRWEPKRFNKDARVMELTTYPKWLTEFHESFSFQPDQFVPWRPHITIYDDDLWELLSSPSNTERPRDAIRVIGPATLKKTYI